MKLLDIKKYPSSVLNKKAVSIVKTDSNLKTLINNMAYTMYESQGVGLAAPQIGVSNRIIVYDINSKSKIKEFNVLINPEILDSSNEIVSESEGCLSIPDFRSNVKRFNEIIVNGIDKNNNQVRIEAKGILSIVLQHEIDHLNGILFIDRISSLKRQLYKKRVYKKLRAKR